MADNISPERRSWVMRQVPGKNTKPELTVRSILHRLGFRFTINAPNNRQLPGKPDIILPKLDTVIFVHGCFWHAHEGCPRFRMPSSRQDYWEEKIGRNMTRDLDNIATLGELGWRVLIVWECETSTATKREELAERLATELPA
ncbi:MAG: very short patch repair endonuclease [Verrucomicrobiota bacterium]